MATFPPIPTATCWPPLLQRSPQCRPGNPKSRRRASLADFFAQVPDSRVQRRCAFRNAIFNLRFLVLAEVVLLLPFVGFLPDVDEVRRDQMPPLSAPAVAEIAIEEFGFRPQMVLRQRFSIGLEFVGWN